MVIYHFSLVDALSRTFLTHLVPHFHVLLEILSSVCWFLAILLFVLCLIKENRRQNNPREWLSAFFGTAAWLLSIAASLWIHPQRSTMTLMFMDIWLLHQQLGKLTLAAAGIASVLSPLRLWIDSYRNLLGVLILIFWSTALILSLATAYQGKLLFSL